MGKSNDSAISIQFWKVVEAKARLAINSIEYAKHTGNDVITMHAEGIADLKNCIDMQKIKVELKKFMPVEIDKNNSPNRSPEEVAKAIASALGFYVTRD